MSCITIKELKEMKKSVESATKVEVCKLALKLIDYLVRVSPIDQLAAEISMEFRREFNASISAGEREELIKKAAIKLRERLKNYGK